MHRSIFVVGLFGLLGMIGGCTPEPAGESGSSAAPWLETPHPKAHPDEQTRQVTLAIGGMT